MKIGIIGSGIVAQTLGGGFLKHGYEVVLGTRNPEKLNKWNEENGNKARIGSFKEAAEFADLIVLAVKGTVAENALNLAEEENLSGKTIIDATNPIAEVPPVNGVLSFFTDLNDSLMEKLQNKFPSANFVKAFSSVGSALMVNPDFKEIKPTMFIAGNSDGSKKQVKIILDKFGWETADMGGPEAARAIEPLCILWCIPGIKDNTWNHAFKLLIK